MTTAADIVNAALKKAGILGVGRVASAMDSNDALSDLNDMLSQWNVQRWLIWHEIDVSFVSTGAQTYTVGPAGNFNVNQRPNRIQAAYARQIVVSGLPIDYPLTVIPAREEFSNLALKSLVSFPKYIFYDSAFPLGTVETYPIMNATLYELHLVLKDVLPTLALGTAISMPGEYIAAMKFNLAKRLRQAYGKGLAPDPELNALAKNSLAIIRGSNMQVPELRMPVTLVRPSLYNVFSDQQY